MTDAQKKARRINYSLMQLEGIIAHLKTLKRMYPGMEYTLATAMKYVEGVGREVRRSRNNPSFIINWRGELG